MHIARLAILIGVTLCGSVEAWATAEDAFLSVLKKFGITADVDTAKKPCLCTGGLLDRQVGRITVQKLPGGSYQFDCLISEFNSAGDPAGSSTCISFGGGSVTVISK